MLQLDAGPVSLMGRIYITGKQQKKYYAVNVKYDID